MRATVVLIMIGAECRREFGTEEFPRREQRCRMRIVGASQFADTGISDVALRSINSNYSLVLLPGEQRTEIARRAVIFTGEDRRGLPGIEKPSLIALLLHARRHCDEWHSRTTSAAGLISRRMPEAVLACPIAPCHD